MQDNGAAGLQRVTERHEEWLRHSQELWEQAHAIAARNPDLDAGDVYHALRSLDFSPSERLHRGLTRVRRRPHAG